MDSIYINVKNADGTVMGRLDVGDSADVNTIYSLADVREPDKKQTDHVETFTIPGTKNNNTIFQHLFENGFSMYQYNPTLKLDAQVILNGNQYFLGALQVNKIHKIDDNFITGYDITIYGKVGSFFSDIDKFKISELVDLSDFAHEYTVDNVVASWDSYIWQNTKKTNFQLGNGYVYPMEHRGQTDAVNWDLSHFKPAVYVKTIFDRILKSQGYTYNSRFLNSDVFRKLILPYTGEENIPLSAQQIANASFLANIRDTSKNDLSLRVGQVSTATNRSYNIPYILFNNDSSLPGTDPGDIFNPATGIITIPKNGNYTIKSTLYTNMIFLRGGDATIKNMKLVGGPVEAMLTFKTYPGGSILKSQAYTYTDPKINSASNAANEPVLYGQKGWYAVDNTYADKGLWTDYQTPNISLTRLFKKGDRIKLYATFTSPKSNWTYKTQKPVKYFGVIIDGKQYDTLMNFYVQARKSNGTYDKNDTSRISMDLADKNFSDGDTMDLNQFLPNTKASDFIKDINKMFNLYWKQTADNEFTIEPRDEFYKSFGKIEDWTNRADNNIEVMIEPLYDLQYKEYKYSYSEDADYYNQDYIAANLDVYGTKRIKIETDFVTDEVETKLSFSATPMINHLATDRVLPSYVKADTSGTFVYSKPKQRILFYGGLLSTGNGWYLNSKFNVNKNPAKYKYPYAGHFDNPISPINDINWGVCKKYYHNWTSVVNNNLFNKYWRSQMEEMTDPNGHLLTVNMILSDIDMINFDIRKVIQFENVYYRVNKLTHNPLNRKAIVELIKMKDYSPFTPSTVTSGAGGQGTLPGNPGIIQWDKGDYPGGTQVVRFGYSGYPTVGNSQVSPAFNVPRFGMATANILRVMSPYTSLSPARATDTGRPLNALASLGKSWADEVPATSFYPTKNAGVDGNFYSVQASQEIMGKNNDIAPDALYVKVQGNGNSVSGGAENVSVVGDNNIIMSGVKNVSVVGNNHLVSKSNVSYFHGTIIDEAGFRKNISLIKSPTNSAGRKSKVIKGGMNSVKASRVLRGGQDRV